MCVCVCVCERERGNIQKMKQINQMLKYFTHTFHVLLHTSLIHFISLIPIS